MAIEVWWPLLHFHGEARVQREGCHSHLSQFPLRTSPECVINCFCSHLTGLFAPHHWVSAGCVTAKYGHRDCNPSYFATEVWAAGQGPSGEEPGDGGEQFVSPSRRPLAASVEAWQGLGWPAKETQGSICPAVGLLGCMAVLFLVF